MKLYFLRDTECLFKNGKYHKAGSSHHISDYKWCEEQIKKGNARKIELTALSLHDQIQEENKKAVLERMEEIKEEKQDKKQKKDK